MKISFAVAALLMTGAEALKLRSALKTKTLAKDEMEDAFEAFLYEKYGDDYGKLTADEHDALFVDWYMENGYGDYGDYGGYGDESGDGSNTEDESGDEWHPGCDDGHGSNTEDESGDETGGETGGSDDEADIVGQKFEQYMHETYTDEEYEEMGEDKFYEIQDEWYAAYYGYGEEVEPEPQAGFCPPFIPEEGVCRREDGGHGAAALTMMVSDPAGCQESCAAEPDCVAAEHGAHCHIFFADATGRIGGYGSGATCFVKNPEC